MAKIYYYNFARGHYLNIILQYYFSHWAPVRPLLYIGELYLARNIFLHVFSIYSPPTLHLLSTFSPHKQHSNPFSWTLCGLYVLSVCCLGAVYMLSMCSPDCPDFSLGRSSREQTTCSLIVTGITLVYSMLCYSDNALMFEK